MVPVFGARGHFDPLGAVGELALGLVFLVVLGYLLGSDTRAMLAARDRYRAAADITPEAPAEV